jgi:formate dehydrogenase
MNHVAITTEVVKVSIDDIIRPKKRSKKERSKPKGRQADSHSIEEVESLKGLNIVRRDLLIENLHLIQDYFDGLKDRHLIALAKLMNLPMTEVYEVASFYHHFDLISDDVLPPEITIRVCDGVACELSGANKLFTNLDSFTSKKVRLIKAPCIGRCEQAPVAVINQNPIPYATKELVQLAISEEMFFHPNYKKNNTVTQKIFNPVDYVEGSLPSLSEDGSVTPNFVNFQSYRENGGYKLAEKFYSLENSLDEAIKVMQESGIRGLGGAGFPVGKKWEIVSKYDGEKLMAVNLDEGEPGTFKDRTYLERDPHRFLEGMLIAAKVVGIDCCYIYLRDEYHGCRKLLAEEILHIKKHLNFKIPKIELRRGAGAYICGEESAMIESIEGKRGEPRKRPPYIAEVGLFGKPTLEHNFESLYWVRDILNRGAKWFSGFGRNGRTGLRSFSVSGRVRNPGVKLAPAGITIQELIDEYCDGMLEGHNFYGYLPGGASGGILPATMNDIPLDFDTLQPYGCFIGSAAIVVFGDKDQARDVSTNIMSFFEHESCGQCTPCRVGTSKAKGLMMEKIWDNNSLDDLKTVMTDASICGLGQAAGNPINCVQKYFPHEVSK